MGLLKDAIGSALGANKPNNGLGGPTTSWNKRTSTNAYDGLAYRRQRNDDNQSYNGQRPYDQDYYDGLACRQQRNENNQSYTGQRPYDQDYYDRAYDGSNYNTRSYQDQPYDDMNWNYQNPPPYDQCIAQSRSAGSSTRQRPASNTHFQPLGLPQIAFGDGQPFLRGYNSQLAQYGIFEKDFLRLVDAINVAIVPNPENQIFQKGASIAGWFV